jgi:hypothetical protein
VHPGKYQKFDIFNSAYEILPLEKSKTAKQTILGLSIFNYYLIQLLWMICSIFMLFEKRVQYTVLYTMARYLVYTAYFFTLTADSPRAFKVNSLCTLKGE